MVYSPNITKLIDISPQLIISTNECGQWLNLSPSAILLEQVKIEQLIKMVTEIIEDYTWLSLRRKTYEAYFDLGENYFYDFINNNLQLELQRAPILRLTDITKIEYLQNDIWNELDRGTMTIDGLYENTTEKSIQRQWARVRFREKINYQERCNAYKIRITFVTGFDPVETEIAYKIPERLKFAIKDIVAYHYTNRGDCGNECSINGFGVPCTVKSMLDQISLSNTVLGTYYNPVNSEYCYEN